MATAQGMCKNCGSLILFDDRDEMCECLFCNCYFPTKEALEIAQNPSEYTFPNEPQPQREGPRRQTIVPVYQAPEPPKTKPKTAEDRIVDAYEVKPEDVRAPKKTLLVILGITLAFILVVGAISYPLYQVRESRRDAIRASIDQVFSAIEVDTTIQDGYAVGYTMRGQYNTVLIAAASGKVAISDVRETYENFAQIRAEVYGLDVDDRESLEDLSLTIFAPNGAFLAQYEDDQIVVGPTNGDDEE